MRILFGSALAGFAFLVTAPLANAVESLVVTTTVDEDNGTSDPSMGTGTSLREAINYANADGVSSAITFSATAFAAPRKTIVLNGTLPTLVPNGSLSITAPAAGVEISGNDTSRIFYIESAAVTITGLTLRNGMAKDDFGGAVFNRAGILLMDSCTLTANIGGAGGAVATNGYFAAGHHANTILRNCTISGNYAYAEGGGVYTFNGPIEIDSCTITKNFADADSQFYEQGGGVSSNRFGDVNAFVRNSIIAGNDPDDVAYDDFTSQGYNLIGVGDTTGQFNKTGDQVIGAGDPGLGALAENGGGTKTCALISTSPARDTGNTELTVDQRGVSRPQGIVDDKGAYEFNTNTRSESLVVTTTVDEDNGTSDPSVGAGTSLREAIGFAFLYGGSNTITFSPSAFAAPRKTIVLNAGQLIVSNGTLSIVAPVAGVEISGNNVSRVFQVNAGAHVTLNGLTIRSGHPPGDTNGGGILNSGALTLTSCTLSGNVAFAGGAVFSDTDLSTALTVSNCTISGNSATQTGGGVCNADGLVTIESSTITSNTAPAGLGSGLLSFGNSATRTEVHNSIVSGNTNTDVDFAGGATNSFQSNGYNLIGDGNAVGDFNQTGDVTGNSDPGLAPALADNGGPTRTRALLLTSPARNTGDTNLAVDQRGFARFQEGADDKGAFELALNESLVVTTTADEDDGTSDPAFGSGTSLREAINRANSKNTACTITFNPAVFNAPRKTITLTQSLPPITVASATSITAPPAGVEIKGNNTFPLFTNGAPLTITGVTFRDGNHNGRGGAIQNVNTLTLDSCTFVNNHAVVGGAVTTENPLTVRNCTFVGNSADNGGAIYVFDGAQVLIESSTITRNTAPLGQGSGVASVGISSTLTHVHNSIIAANTNGDVDFVFGSTNSFQSDGHNLIGDGNATADFNQPGDVLIGNGNPRLSALADNGGPAQTMALEATSLAIDKGNSSVAVDQRGMSRVDFASIPNATDGNGSDIGAYELVTQPAGIFLVRSFLPHNPTLRSVLLPLNGGGVECRVGGANGTFQVVFSFLQPLSSVGSVRVSAGTGKVVTASSGIDSDAHNFTATLIGVANAQTITVTLDNVQDTAGGFSSAVSADMGVLLGDVNGDGAVNSADATITRARSGQAATSANFRADVNRDGTINSGDATIVRARSGQSIP